MNDKGNLITPFEISDYKDSEDTKFKLKNKALQNHITSFKSHIANIFFKNHNDIVEKNQEIFIKQANRVNEYYSHSKTDYISENEVIRKEFLYKIKEEQEYHQIKLNIDFIGITQVATEAVVMKFDEIFIYHHLYDNKILYPLLRMVNFMVMIAWKNVLFVIKST